MSSETREQLESSRARHAHESSSYRDDAKRAHERLRLLENAVRRHADRECACSSPGACLTELSRRIPQNPRPKYGRRS